MVHTHALVNGFIFHLTHAGKRTPCTWLTHSDTRSLADTDQDETFCISQDIPIYRSAWTGVKGYIQRARLTVCRK